MTYLHRSLEPIAFINACRRTVLLPTLYGSWALYGFQPLEALSPHTGTSLVNAKPMEHMENKYLFYHLPYTPSVPPPRFLSASPWSRNLAHFNLPWYPADTWHHRILLPKPCLEGFVLVRIAHLKSGRGAASTSFRGVAMTTAGRNIGLVSLSPWAILSLGSVTWMLLLFFYLTPGDDAKRSVPEPPEGHGGVLS
jgi:hypothetical protein